IQVFVESIGTQEKYVTLADFDPRLFENGISAIQPHRIDDDIGGGNTQRWITINEPTPRHIEFIVLPANRDSTFNLWLMSTIIRIDDSADFCCVVFAQTVLTYQKFDIVLIRAKLDQLVTRKEIAARVADLHH